MRNIRPIRSEADYDWALEEIARYFGKQPAHGSPDADRFDLLSSLIEHYENLNWAIEGSDPIETLATTIAAQGRSQADFGKLIGSRSRASEILSRRRPLTLAMIRKLEQEWGIPAGALAGEYELRLVG
jgi:HTH-type transcriptional regulator/antitoxin HigA